MNDNNLNTHSGKKVVSTWRGKPLEEYSKEELIEIVIQLGKSLQQEHYEHSRQLDVFSDLLKGTK